jgi:transcriptional regulator with XRE-family HTH domain
MTVDTVQVPRSNLRPPGIEDIAARRIAYERNRLNLSTEELARRVTAAGCRIHASAVWRIENGTPRRKISLDEALAFAQVFGITLEQLMEPPEADVRDRVVELTWDFEQWNRDAQALFGRLQELLHRSIDLLSRDDARGLLARGEMAGADSLLEELARQMSEVEKSLGALIVQIVAQSVEKPVEPDDSRRYEA